MPKKLFFIFLLILAGTKPRAQDRYLVGLMPSVNLNARLAGDWRLNFRMESRQLLREGIFGAPTKGRYRYDLTDFIALGSRRIGLNNSLAVGYLLRVEQDEIVHRLIQQFTMVQRFPAFRIAHRISTDQTFRSDEATEYRLRYRLTPEIPLNGQSIDPGEFYLKVNHEYLQSLQEGEYDLEIRMVPLLGYEFSKNNKLEGGLDYRINSFISGNARNSFWICLHWFFSID